MSARRRGASGGGGRRAPWEPAAWLVGAAVLAGIVLRPAFRDELFVTRYTGYVMPWLLVGLVPGAAWAALARRRALAALLALSAAIVVAIHAPLFRGRPASATRGAVTLKVMSYNTWSRNDDARRISDVIRGQAPDVVLLQETPPAVFSRVRDALRDLYGADPLHWAYDPALQQAVLSRHPVEARPSLAEKGKAQRVVLLSPAGPVAVFNVHPLRTGGWRHRYGQIAALLEDDVLPERSPVILAGDLNVNDRSQLYHLLSERLENAHDAAGFGFGFTYPSAVRVLVALPAVPAARIDHVFFSAHFVALRAGTIADSGGSDHRPVFAELALVERSPAAPPDPGGSSAGPRPHPSSRSCPGSGAGSGRCADSRRPQSLVSAQDGWRMPGSATGVALGNKDAFEVLGAVTRLVRRSPRAPSRTNARGA